MTRDTAVAIWYRRLDPSCFTSNRPVESADGRPSMEISYGAGIAPEAPVYATAVSDHWPSLDGDQREWPTGAAATRL